MPRKLRPYRTPMKPAIEKYADDEQSRFVFTVDPQCIITFPIDHCLYVCDICSSVLKTQDSFKKHYIKLHINHAHAALSDLKFSEAFPINLSKFKEDEGWFRCHFCIGLFFTEKSDLKLHLNQHGPLQEIPEEQCVVPESEIKEQKGNDTKSNGEAVTIKMTPCNSSDNDKISASLISKKLSMEKVVTSTSVLTELLPLPIPNLPTSSEVFSSLSEPLVTETPKCNVDEVNTEPLSGLLGISLLTLFDTSPNVLSDHISTFSGPFLPGPSNVERSSSPIFAQDCTISDESFTELTTISSCPAATPQSTTDDLPVQSIYCALTSLPESSSLPLRENSSSSISSSSGFSSASTEDLLIFEENDASERSEESFSSLTSSKSNSDEESTPAESKNTFDINMDNIVLSCLFCEKIFASIKSTRTHMLKAHQSKVHWECVFCKTNFKNCDFLLNHLCSNHSDIYFACISCKVRFDTKAFMDTHFQNKHNTENTTNIFSKMSELKNKDDILQQLKCIPYYTNQNVISNLLSRKIKLTVFDKLSFSGKPQNQKQVTNRSVQVSEEDISQECQKESQPASNFNGSILKRKLTEDTTSPQSKVIKMSKNFNQVAIENNIFKSKLLALLPSTPPSLDSSQEVVVESLGVVDDFLSDADNAEKYLANTAVKIELDHNNSTKKILCLFCTKTSFSLKGNNTHIAKVHKIRRGGKNCCFCKSNFRTLDLLFSHLCSNHAHVYFACVFCKERFDSKSSLLMHFDTEHDSVNVNIETISEDLSTTSGNLKKEHFMYELKCLPNYPYKPTCSPDCKMCSSIGEGDLQTQTLSDTTLLCQLEVKLRDNKIIEDGTTQLSVVENFSPVEVSQNHMEHLCTEPDQLYLTKHNTQPEVGVITNLSKDKSLVELNRNSDNTTESDLKLSSVEDVNSLVTSVDSSELTLEVTKPPVTIGNYEELSIELICLFCDRTFDKAKAFRVHLFRSHKAKKNKCIFCNTMFSYYEDLFDHLISTHSNVYFACNVCKLRHSTKALLNEHVVNFHTLEQERESNSKNQTLEDNKVPHVPISTEKVQDISIPNRVPEINTNEVINDPQVIESFTEIIPVPPCSKVVENLDKKSLCPLAELGLHPGKKDDKVDESKNESKDTSSKDTSKIDHSSASCSSRQLIKYNHPEYENIAMKNYSHLDITVQLQVLSRVKGCTSGKQHTPLYPLKRPQKQPKTSGKYKTSNRFLKFSFKNQNRSVKIFGHSVIRTRVTLILV